MIHTKAFTTVRKGLKRDIEPNETIKPRGSAITNVKIKSKQVVPNPSNNLSEISPKVINLYFALDRSINAIASGSYFWRIASMVPSL